MWWGIAVQSLLIAGTTLGAFLIGLRWHEGRAEQIPSAQTLALATLVTAELLRAFTARSERVSLWRLGLPSNRNMLWAVASSFLILLAIIYVPFLDPVFHTTFLTPPEWGVLLLLSLVPALGAEATKALLRWRERRRARTAPPAPVKEEASSEAADPQKGD
jgi:Ca2+-transporting ATPase